MFGPGDSQPINRFKIFCRSMASEKTSPAYGLTGSGKAGAHPFYLLRFGGGLSGRHRWVGPHITARQSGHGSPRAPPTLKQL